MPASLGDLTGQRYGMWVVLGAAESRLSRRGVLTKYWLCRCDCGNEREVVQQNLRNGISSNCGCLRYAALSERNTTHGLSGHPLFPCWYGMVQRCTNPRCNIWCNYGAKGITVHEPWLTDPLAFFEYMGPKPDPSCTIDRYPNQKGNYEPGNVRWATWGEQARNKATNVLIELNGETLCLADAAAALGVSRPTAYSRLRRGRHPLPGTALVPPA